jgi:hypothetical protein
LELAIILRRLWTLRLWVLGAFVVALGAGVVAVYRVDLGVPPKLERRSLTYGTGRVQLLVDSPRSPLVDVSAPVDAVTTRAQLYASFIRSSQVVEAIAHEVGIPAGQLYIANAARPSLVTQSRIAEQRANALFYEVSGYRLYVSTEPQLPVITISGLAPSGPEAARLVNGASTAVTKLVREREQDAAITLRNRVEVSQLGRPAGSTLNSGVRKQVALLVFVITLALGCLLVLVGANIAGGIRRLASEGTGRSEALGDA